MKEVTRILIAIEQGDPQAAEQLLPVVYEQLRHLAAQKLARERPGQTLQGTALVHEAYVRLIGAGSPPKKWNGPGHFYAAAAEAMRRILIERARRRRALKRGNDGQRVELDQIELAAEAPSQDALALAEALEKLERAHPGKADLVKLRFYAGLTTAEAAAILGISVATAERHWTYARAWLYAAINE